MAEQDKIYRPLRISRLDRALGAAPTLLGVLLGAVAVHLTILLALPALWPASAYRALAARAPLGAPWLAPRPGFDAQDRALGRAGGFDDPFAALAICRFDLRRGPLHLTAAADGERPFSLSIRLIDGAILYSSNDRQTPHGRFDVVILTQAQADAQDRAEAQSQDRAEAQIEDRAQAQSQDRAQEKDDALAKAETNAASEADKASDGAPVPAADAAPLRLIAPAPRGFAVFRVLARDDADYEAAAARRAAIACALTPAP